MPFLAFSLLSLFCRLLSGVLFTYFEQDFWATYVMLVKDCLNWNFRTYLQFFFGWSLTRPMHTLSNVQMNMTSHLKNTYFASENHSCAIGWMLNVVAVEDFLPKDVKWNNFKLFVWVNCISKSLTLFANFQTKFSHNVNKRCWNMVRGKETKTDMKSLVTKRERLTVYYFCKELNFVCFHLLHANEW